MDFGQGDRRIVAGIIVQNNHHRAVLNRLKADHDDLLKLFFHSGEGQVLARNESRGISMSRPPQAKVNKKLLGTRASLLGARTLLGAPGLTTSNNKATIVFSRPPQAKVM